jgi:rod shape-determining protein MreC
VARIRLDRLTPIVTLIVFLFIWWLTPSFIKLFTQASFEEIQAPIWIATNHLETIANTTANKTKSKQALIDTISELKRQNAYYKQIKNINENYKAEISRLESILNLPSRDRFRYELAHVIQRNMGSWWQTIRINKGSKHGIQNGDAVIFIGGVVGRIAKTNYYSSQVDLLSNHSFRISASFMNDYRPLFYQGKGTDLWGQPKGSIKNAPQDLTTDSAKPLQLVTTGLGGTFPEGIAIGLVPWLEPDNTGMFQAGEVQLDKRLLGIKEVAVLIPFNRIETLEHDF